MSWIEVNSDAYSNLCSISRSILPFTVGWPHSTVCWKAFPDRLGRGIRTKSLKFTQAHVEFSDDRQVRPDEHGERGMERNKQTPGVNGIMDISEAADYLHIKKWTLYRLVKRGKIPGIKVGGQWRFKKEVLDEMFTQKAD